MIYLSLRQKIKNKKLLIFTFLTLYFSFCINVVWAENAEIIVCKSKNLNEISNEVLDLDDYPFEIRKIIEDGVIKISMKQGESEPFFFQDEGKIFGLDFELGCAIAKELGVEAHFIRDQASFNGTVDNVINEKTDIAISKISATLQREKKVLFTDAYAKFSHGFLINRERIAMLGGKGDKYQNINNFVKDGKVEIGVIKNSSYEYFANKYFDTKVNKSVKIVSYDNWDDLIH